MHISFSSLNRARGLSIIFLAVFFLFLPVRSFAAVNSINGLTGATQTLLTGTSSLTMHMQIQSGGSSHIFRWDGTPWTLAQGGTNSTTVFATSSVPFINNSKFSVSTQFQWDPTNSVLNIGTPSSTSSPVAKLNVFGSGTLKLIDLSNASGTSMFSVTNAGATTIAGTLNVTGTSTLSSNVFAGSNVFVTGTTQTGGLSVTGSATSTFVKGIDISGGCFAINGTCVGGGASLPSVPTYTKLTSTSLSTYTVPAGVRQLKIRMVGGGGGGAGIAATDSTSGSMTLFGTGQSTTTASGGDRGLNNGTLTLVLGGTGGVTGIGTEILRTHGSDGVVYTVAGNSDDACIGRPSVFGGAGGCANNNGGTNAASNSGSGGGGAVDTSSGMGGGAAGEYVEFYINNPAASYDYIVGAGGTGGTGTRTGGNGADGVILIEEIY